MHGEELGWIALFPTVNHDELFVIWAIPSINRGCLVRQI